jgi:hypothetical protein
MSQCQAIRIDDTIATGDRAGDADSEPAGAGAENGLALGKRVQRVGSRSFAISAI